MSRSTMSDGGGSGRSERRPSPGRTSVPGTRRSASGAGREDVPEGVSAPARAGDCGATREALAHVFMAEYHRLLADACVDPEEAEVSDGRRRAFAWRVTAGRIPHVPTSQWPDWLLRHLDTVADTPVVGAEYRRQRALLVELLGS